MSPFPYEWITVEKPSLEVWRRLFEFCNQEIATNAIAEIHGGPSVKDRANYRKQADQIRVAILQAKEYFDAAERATVFTRANHLFYGTVSLCSAVMLLRGGGDKSLDRLRSSPLNRSHGLGFSLGANAASCALDVNLLALSFVEIQTQGFFQLWASELPSFEEVYATMTEIRGSSKSSNKRVAGLHKLTPVRTLAGQKFTLLELLSSQPDLFVELQRIGIAPVGSRVSFDVEIVRGEGLLTKAKLDWRLHGANNEADLFKILEEFRFPPALVPQVHVIHLDGSAGCQILVSIDDISNSDFKFPGIRETLTGVHVSYATANIHQLAEAYMLAYGLSMLSRYFPDIWVKTIESRCKSAQMIEWFLAVLASRIPRLCLSLLSSAHIVVSTNRAPWHSH